LITDPIGGLHGVAGNETPLGLVVHGGVEGPPAVSDRESAVQQI
jgi:hypothetical protein